MSESTAKHIQILHLSDLHFGIGSQKTLWPTFKTAFFNDLRKMAKKNGAWDIVVFSGDLTQSGKPQEYANLTLAMREIWDVFSEFDFAPTLFVVPGNHDLQRPDPVRAAVAALSTWNVRPDIQALVLGRSNNEYRAELQSCFSSYTKWYSELGKQGINILGGNCGLLPGDISGRLENSNTSVGLVGLNSSWLQLDGSNFHGRLHVDNAQLMGVTGHDPDKWARNNDFNLLVTHHPTSWLLPGSQISWRSEIYGSNRFDAHLFGHMHELRTETTSINGSHQSRTIQGASLFGLERINDVIERRHGYSLIRLSCAPTRKFRLWPRRAQKIGGGTLKIVPDYEFALGDDEESVTFELEQRSRPSTEKYLSSINSEESSSLKEIGSSPSILNAIRKDFRSSPAYSEVRKIEQERGINELRGGRALWIESDWGLGTAEYIHSLQLKLGTEVHAFQLDIHDCKNSDALLAQVQHLLGCSFEQMCQYLATAGDCLLILDDANVSLTASPAAERDISEIVDAVRTFAPKVNLVFTSRLSPGLSKIRTIKLQPLNEADTGAFLRAHSLSGGAERVTAAFVSSIYRHTDGVPVRLESALKHVQLVGIEELASLNSDIAGKNAGEFEIAPGLMAAINDLETTQDPAVTRAYQLLKALTMFPAGERFNTVRRFNGPDGFYPQNAQYLIENALVDLVEIDYVSEIGAADSARALVVRRPVREYLYSQLSANEIKSLNKKAMTIYFGRDWTVDGIKPISAMKVDNPRQSGWVLNNANLMVLRTVKEAVEGQSDQKIVHAVKLLCSYCAKLISGTHFRATTMICEDAVPLLEQLQELPAEVRLDFSLVKSHWAEALRMVGPASKARDIARSVEGVALSKVYRQSNLLTLALTLSKLDENAEALRVAKECIAIDSETEHAFQAKTILVECDDTIADKEKQRKSLESLARKKGFTVTANNMALTRANELGATLEAAAIAKMVASSAGNTDNYNAIRALVIVARSDLTQTGTLDGPTLRNLIQAYHYLYSQRFGSLFDKCHAILWDYFEHTSERLNLLRLFRHSSLMWRLRAKSQLELTYLSKLTKLITFDAAYHFSENDVELGYFAARSLQRLSTSTIHNGHAG